MHWEEEEAKEDFSIKASFHLLHWSIFTFYVKGIFQWNDQTRHTQESDTFKWEKEKKIGMKAVVLCSNRGSNENEKGGMLFLPQRLRFSAIFRSTFWLVSPRATGQTSVGRIIACDVSDPVTTRRWTLNQIFSIFASRGSSGKGDVTVQKSNSSNGKCNLISIFKRWGSRLKVTYPEPVQDKAEDKLNPVGSVALGNALLA